MSRVAVIGGKAAGRLAAYLRDGLAGVAGVERAGGGSPAGEALLTVMLLDRPLEGPFGGRCPDVVLVDRGGPLEGLDELGLEAWLKATTGAKKVLVFRGEEERERAFAKVRDMALSRAGGGKMPEEIPERVAQAVRAAAVDGRMTCERARELARELGVPIPLVGRALDLLGIKITSCELGCF